MGKSLSLDIRERVVALVDEGVSCREAARRLRISAASAVRIIQLRKMTGSVAPRARGRPRGGGKLDAVAPFLRREIETRPDMTMPELAERLRATHAVSADPAELSRYLRHRLGLTYKSKEDQELIQWINSPTNRSSRQSGDAVGCAPRGTTGGTGGCQGCALNRTD